MSQMRSPMLDPRLQQMIRSELGPDEQLVWSDKPMLATFCAAANGKVIVGIFMIGVMFYVRSQTAHIQRAPGAPDLSLIFTVPVGLSALWLMSSPYWAVRRARQTVYVLTNQRATVIRQRSIGKPKVRSYTPEQLSQTLVQARSDGAGDLVFDQIRHKQGKTGHYSESFGFLGIQNVHEVIALIRATLPGSAPK